jgi:heparan-alpha-glucosaminide N-acetyltransferase
MTATTLSTAPDSDALASVPARPARITSIDALRGLVMFTMIFVNDLAGVSDKIVPAWMKHFHGKSGMTFVDLVFPAFLFIVGMSIPFGLGSRLSKGEPLGKIILHVVVRTLSLLFIGILMVNETPSSEKMGWSGALWATLMYFAAILTFCTIAPPQPAAATGSRQRTFRLVSLGLRFLGLTTLVFLAFAFRGEDGHRIISFAPFSVHTEWYGILGLIGWAYLVGALVFLCFRGHRTALLGCVVLLLCLYPADRHAAFNGFWLAQYVGIGGTLGSQAAITVAGLLLATILVAPDTGTVWLRTRFALLFIAGCAAGAWLLHGLYGINKNQATPSWCLWGCAITAALWLLFYFLSDVSPLGFIGRPFAVAGQNVFLAYLLSEMLPSVIDLLHLGGWYGRLAEPSLAYAVARSAGCAAVILCLTAALNRIGFRLKL